MKTYYLKIRDKFIRDIKNRVKTLLEYGIKAAPQSFVYI